MKCRMSVARPFLYNVKGDELTESCLWVNEFAPNKNQWLNKSNSAFIIICILFVYLQNQEGKTDIS